MHSFFNPHSATCLPVRQVRNPQWRGRLLAFFALTLLLLSASPASAQVEVTASLDATDGWARPGAYVPVTLKVINNTKVPLVEVRASTGGPVSVLAPWNITPGNTCETFFPIFFVGGDLRIALEFMDDSGRVAARATVVPSTVRILPPDMALVAIAQGLPDLNASAKERIRSALKAKAIQLVSLPKVAIHEAKECGMWDGRIVEDDWDVVGGYGRTMIIKTAALAAGELPVPFFPTVTEELVQPEAFRLFAVKTWPAQDRLRLWVWLAIFALAATVVGILIGRRRPRLAAGAIVGLAATAVAFIWFFGDVKVARIREARIFYVGAAKDRVGMEHFLSLESRGQATGRFTLIRPRAPWSNGDFFRGDGSLSMPWPLPILAGSEDLFRPQGTLRLGSPVDEPTRLSQVVPDMPPLESARSHLQDAEQEALWRAIYNSRRIAFESRQPQVLLHILNTVKPPFDAKVKKVSPAELQALASRPDMPAALLVENDSATDAAGRTQTIEAWATEWKSSDDPDIAYAGRSLTWWNKERREGAGPALVAWFRDPLPDDPTDATERVRLPALVIYTAE